MYAILRTFILFGMFLFPLSLFASVYFWHALPNTTDDSNLEYVELRNTGCDTVSLAGYRVSDASGKQYIFSTGTIESYTGYVLTRPISKIILNNTNETLFLHDGSGVLIDEWGYTTSEKGIVLTHSGMIDIECHIPIVSGEGTVSGESLVSGEKLVSGEVPTLFPEEQTGTGTPLFIEKLLATSLGYADEDSDGYIDTITISYETDLTGSVNTGAIALYSNTGGLYENRINTLTGYIQSATLSGSQIFLSILPATIKKSEFKINNTTSSEIRLKSWGDLGISTVQGQEIEGFFLTTSFDSYKNILHPLMSDTQEVPIIPEKVAEFPDIIPTLQQYSNMTLSGDTFVCMSLPCRLNLTFDPIFTGSFLKKNYTCQISFSGDTYDTCNPPQFSPIVSGSLHLTLIEKLTNEAHTQEFFIEIPENLPSKKSPKPNPIKDTNPPVAVLEFDGTLRSYYEQVGDYEFNCYTFTCSINLTAEHSYDAEGSVHFLWVFGQGNIRTVKDPGTQKYGLGDHEIVLRVFDMAGNYGEIRYLVHVLGPKPKIEKVKKISTKKEKVSTVKTVKKKTLKKMIFFDPPSIELQKSKFILVDDVYICHTFTKTCSINFTLSGAQKGIAYSWKYDDGSESISKNPRSKSFSTGKHTIEVRASYSGSTDVLWQQTLSLHVIHDIKPKKPKKITKKTQKISTQIASPTIDGVPKTFQDRTVDPIAFSIFSGMGLFVFWYRRKILNTVIEQNADTKEIHEKKD